MFGHSRGKQTEEPGRWGSTDESQERPPRDPGHEDALDELPPNVPPGWLGEMNPDLRKVDGDGPHGLNAGMIQEWTAQTTMLIVVLVCFFFFPAAYVILWRSRKVSRDQKIGLSVVMAAGIVLVAYRVLSG